MSLAAAEALHLRPKKDGVVHGPSCRTLPLRSGGRIGEIRIEASAPDGHAGSGARNGRSAYAADIAQARGKAVFSAGTHATLRVDHLGDRSHPPLSHAADNPPALARPLPPRRRFGHAPLGHLCHLDKSTRDQPKPANSAGCAHGARPAAQRAGLGSPTFGKTGEPTLVAERHLRVTPALDLAALSAKARSGR